jgi:hypothetical protein
MHGCILNQFYPQWEQNRGRDHAIDSAAGKGQAHHGLIGHSIDDALHKRAFRDPFGPCSTFKAPVTEGLAIPYCLSL